MKTGQQESFETLVRQHHRRVLAFAISLTGDEEAARDIAQDSFVAACQNWGKFDETKDFGAWMRGIVRNKCREHSRSRRFVTLDEPALEALELQHRQWDELEAEIGAQLFDSLHLCLNKLPATLSRVVELYYLKRLSGADVARRLKLDEATVRKRLQRARTQLAECISKARKRSD